MLGVKIILFYADVLWCALSGSCFNLFSSYFPENSWNTGNNPESLPTPHDWGDFTEGFLTQFHSYMERFYHFSPLFLTMTEI